MPNHLWRSITGSGIPGQALVVISNSCIKAISAEGKVTFGYKDYVDGNKQKDRDLPGA